MSGVVSTAHEYEDTLQAIVASTSPTVSVSSGSGLDHVDLLAAGRQYGLNTLRRLRPLVNDSLGIAGAAVISYRSLRSRLSPHH